MPAIITTVALLIAVAFGYLATTMHSAVFIAAIGLLLVASFSFMYPKHTMAMVVFSMLLSPKLGFGAVNSSREAVLRYDDVLLVIMFFSWFARTAIIKGKSFITSTPLQLPIFVYTSVYVLATALGIIRGNLNWLTAQFYLLKYVEYFLLYFMTVNIVENKEEMKRYLSYGWVVALIVTVYAFYSYATATIDPRATAPFEATLGSSAHASEPASLGGYYLVIFGIIVGLITEYSGYILIMAMASLALMFPAFLLTFSRSSYIGFCVLVAALIYFSNKRKVFIFLSLSTGLFIVSLLPGMAKKVSDRITMTYSGAYATNSYQVGGSANVKLEDSASARVNTLRITLFERLPQHPFLGLGITGIGIGDTQYALVIGETGLIGLFAFLWMIVVAFKTARTVYRTYSEPWIRALSLGFISTLPALLAQSVGVNTFIIIRIMEPFWFVAAIINVLYNQIENKNMKNSGPVPGN